MTNKQEFDELGFTILNTIYSDTEINTILNCINSADSSKLTFRKTNDLFAIRQFLKELPNLSTLIFNEKLKIIIEKYIGKNYFIVKSIYFDKPEKSNWFVSYHQDLTISVDKKIKLENYGPWTIKQDQFAVQPPLSILENIYTIRVHLDNTDKDNGALKVIPKSHLKGIYRPETIDWKNEYEEVCSVNKGGIMLMRPLLLHSSSRTTNTNQRRVIHIELSNSELSSGLNWSEKYSIDK